MLSALRVPRGKDRYETAENYAIACLFAGAVMFSAGVGLAGFWPAGATTVLAMLGAVVSFASAVAIVAAWLAKDLLGKEG